MSSEIIKHQWGLFFGGLIMAAGILLAAAGSHLLDSDKARGLWQTANIMHLVHGLGLMFLSVLRQASDRHKFHYCWHIAVAAIVVGLILFCLQLYLKSLQIEFLPGWLTPIGGGSFVVAWVCASMLAFRVPVTLDES